ncbi:MAG: NAD(P)/FAD-dependent oxidoreductase [Actinobacteria bacterium]|nr:NAD(P)/FAD-dependent oxidoreductase [Actinomycetota bacterium]
MIAEPSHATDLAAEAPEHEVAVIGAGLSGIGVAAAMRRAGIDDFVILERAGDVGGTWRDNTYPGVGVDIPAFAYQFSYELKPDWSRLFPAGHEVKAYIDDFVEKHAIHRHVAFHSEVTVRTWDEDNHLWRLEVNGGEREVTARFVVSAIGAFVDPKPVKIEGLDDFAGKVIHSARWDHGYDLAGKRVAVVGTGASAVQIIPSIAQRVARLDVYQRTPIWVLPKTDPPIPEPLKRLFSRVPLTERIARAVASSITELILIFMTVNYRRLGFFARRVEDRGRRYIAASVRDEELRRKLTPDYGFGCKRPSISNDYLRAFRRPDVELVTERIDRVTPSGIRTADGRERDVDAIVLATGFRLASDPENYRRTPVRGRDGFDLASHYERNHLKAYEGITMPGLPNHFIVFGPYGWTGASWHVLVQTAARHITRVIGECRRRGVTAVEVSEAATERFHSFIQERMQGSLWLIGNCATANSYYFDHHGDVPYLRPTSGRQASRASRTFPLDDYRYRTLRPGAQLGEAYSTDRSARSKLDTV